MPTESAAMPTRPPSKTFMVSINPIPSLPKRFLAGITTFSKTTSVVSDEFIPNLCIPKPDLTPAQFFSTINALIPLVPFDGSVLANTT